MRLVEGKPMRHRTPLLIAVLASVTLCGAIHGDLVVTPMGGGLSATAMAQALLSDTSGIVINSATYTGVNAASGTFSAGGSIVGIENGILLTSGGVTIAPGPNDEDGAGVPNFAPGNAQLEALLPPPGADTFDASVLTINFTPTGSQIQFSYVFASEEYNEYVGSDYNDIFAFFVGATNYAVLPGTNTPVAINNVNCGFGGFPPTNCNYYIDNENGALNTQFDGMTTVLTFTAPVNPGVQNTMRLAIADVADPVLDSAVFLLGESLTDVGGCVANATTACLLGNRYEVRVNWEDYQHVHHDAFVAAAGTPESALFYYLQANPNNWEFVIKLIDGCGFNDRVWVYMAAATDVGYVVTVRDTAPGGTTKTYTNVLGHVPSAVNDSSAFNTCV
jgi:hypothetical protein